MADRIEREINEILEKLDRLPDDGGAERTPISLAEHRERRPKPPKGPSRSLASFAPTPTHALLAGAATVIGGLVLSNVWAPLIWAAFAGVALFVGGFIAAIVKRPKTAASGAQPSGNGAYWRDRYIQYEEPSESTWKKLRRRFRV